MATRGPAGADSEKRRVRNAADENLAGGALRLRVTAQAKIRIALDEHFAVDRAVRIVAGRAAFAQRLVLEGKGPRLVAMTLRAALVDAGQRESARRFHDIHPVRIVTLHAIHFALDHRVMLRQVEFRLDFHMALEARGRVLARVDDEFVRRVFNVFAARPVAGFTTGLVASGGFLKMRPGMRAGGKPPDVIGVAIGARAVTHIMRPGDLRGDYDGPGSGRARLQQERQRAGKPGENESGGRNAL